MPNVTIAQPGYLIPKPRPIDLQDVRFVVVKMPEGNLITLTAQEYQKLSLNMAEIIRYVTEADKQIDYYREQNETRTTNSAQ